MMSHHQADSLTEQDPNNSEGKKMEEEKYSQRKMSH